MSDATPSPLNVSGDAPTIGECRESWLDFFYASLFHPFQTFRALADLPEPDTRLLFHSLLSILLVSTMAPISRVIDTTGDPADLAMMIPFSVLVGVLLWGFMALVVSMLAYAYTGSTRLRTFLALSGQATLPWVFMAPVSLLKIGIGLPGLIICALLGLAIWIWTILLFALAVMAAYTMSLERALIVLAAPFAMMLVLIGWLLGFINHFVRFFP